MGHAKHAAAAAVSFLASGGWADQDPDVMADLVQQAQELALAVVADPHTDAPLRARAQTFLDRLDGDTLR